MTDWRRFARWLLGRWVFFRDPARHGVPCKCRYHIGWRHGYLQAGAEASMAADEDARFRRFLRSYEMPVEERR